MLETNGDGGNGVLTRYFLRDLLRCFLSHAFIKLGEVTAFAEVVISSLSGNRGICKIIQRSNEVLVKFKITAILLSLLFSELHVKARKSSDDVARRH